MGAVDQQLLNRTLLALRRDGPQTLEDLAVLLGVPEEVKSACFALRGRKQLDIAEGYFCLAVQPDSRRT